MRLQYDGSQNSLGSVALAGFGLVVIFTLLALSRSQKHSTWNWLVQLARPSHASSDLPPEFKHIVPYKGLPINEEPKWPHFWKPGVFQMTMGLKKLDPNNWLTYDKNWAREYRRKLEWLDGDMRDEIVRVLPNADTSCEELLEVVVAYVTKRYPDMFQMDGDEIVIVPFGDRYRVKKPYDRHPMALIGLVAMDDFYVLHRGEMDLYYLYVLLNCPLLF
jgi:hypothetical protein